MERHTVGGRREVDDERTTVSSGLRCAANPGIEDSAGSPGAVARPGFPQIRACPIKAHGSSCHVFATDGTLSGSLSPAEASNAPARDRIEPKASDGPVCDEKASASIFLWQHSGIVPGQWNFQ